MKAIHWLSLLLIVVAGLYLRFYQFQENVYFGFDEARDAYVSQSIYNEHDYKLIGPPANGASGLNHGVLHWYLIGIFYKIGNGSPYFVSAIFRVLNILAIWPIFWISKRLFNRRVAMIAASIFACSFEAIQYAMYYGNPSLAIWSWIILFVGATIIYKEKNKFWGLPLMAIGIGTGAQFELFLVTLLLIGVIVLWVLRRFIKEITFKSWFVAIGLGAALFSTYILAEIKNNFRGLGVVWKILTSGYAGSGESRWVLYGQRWLLMIKDNLWAFDHRMVWFVGVLLLLFWLYQAKREIAYRLLLVWVLGGVFVFMLGTYNAYYINVGIGTGIVIGASALIDKIWNKNSLLAMMVLLVILGGEVHQVRTRGKEGLVEDIKTQQFMFLSQEISIVDQMYHVADKKPFTLRVTSMPYKIQTVWAYIFEKYGKTKYGYLPYFENGNALGFPGKLPITIEGTTCTRFLLREPYGGIPSALIHADINEEDLFSKIVETKEIGSFHLEIRTAYDKKCQDNIFPL